MSVLSSAFLKWENGTDSCPTWSPCHSWSSETRLTGISCVTAGPAAAAAQAAGPEGRLGHSMHARSILRQARCAVCDCLQAPYAQGAGGRAARVRASQPNVCPYSHRSCCMRFGAAHTSPASNCLCLKVSSIGAIAYRHLTVLKVCSCEQLGMLEDPMWSVISSP